MLLDVVGGPVVLLVPALGHRDKLDAGDAVLLVEDAVDAVKVRGHKLITDGLEHLARQKLVERLGAAGEVLVDKLAVVLEQDGNLVRETGLGDALLGELLLLDRQSQRGNPAARLLDGFHGHRAPAGTDLENVVGVVDAGLGDHGM